MPESLSKIEASLLKAMDEGEALPVEEIAKRCKMSKDAVLKAAFMLKEKGYADVVEVIEEIYELTEEGKKYLKDGLPEEKLLKFVKSGKNSVKELKDEMGREFEIGLGWLRKKGAVKIEGGVIEIIREPEFYEREALRKLEEGKAGDVDTEIIKTLIRRKLIRKDEKKRFVVKLLKKPEIEVKAYITNLTPEIILSGEWKEREFLSYDISLPSKEVYGGKVHPYERIIRECRKIFLEMGFKEIKGNYVQTAFWNFDALFQPQDHPARDMQDTFYLNKFVDLNNEFVEKVKETHENGWKTGSSGWGGKWDLKKAQQLVLRTHTTAITIHYLAENPEPPQKAFCIDRVYRREAIDATHLPEFDQLEGVVLDRNVGFRHLLGLLKEFFVKMGFEEVRFRPGYFPYTEPSVEPEVYVDGLGWIELGGAGVFRKEVTEPFGIKGKVLAWGLGIGRLAMLRLGMKDLRRLYLPDLGWLRQMPVVRR